MKLIYRIIILTLLLLGAVACYSFGIPAGGVVFLVLGLVFEAVLWTRLFRRRSPEA